MIRNNDKIIRLRYVRILEKFITRTIKLLKHPKFDFKLFIIQTQKNYIFVENIKAIQLNSEYLKQLLSYVTLIIKSIHNHSKTFQDEKQLLLKESNLLHKQKNRATYKKDKHTKKKFYDGY
jgi:hypothetical protein